MNVIYLFILFMITVSTNKFYIINHCNRSGAGTGTGTGSTVGTEPDLDKELDLDPDPHFSLHSGTTLLRSQEMLDHSNDDIEKYLFSRPSLTVL
jgi:hypothetical protein